MIFSGNALLKRLAMPPRSRETKELIDRGRIVIEPFPKIGRGGNSCIFTS